VKSVIPQLLKVAVNDEDEDVRTAGEQLLKSLDKDSMFSLIMYISIKTLITFPSVR
jgi:16S rRNA C1402 N4-methylase RsmH